MHKCVKSVKSKYILEQFNEKQRNLFQNINLKKKTFQQLTFLHPYTFVHLEKTLSVSLLSTKNREETKSFT